MFARTLARGRLVCRLIMATAVCIIGCVASGAHADGCACPCSEGNCIWNAATVRPCDDVSPEVCECPRTSSTCTSATREYGMLPEPGEVLTVAGIRPDGTCCEIGCYGDCYALCNNPCSWHQECRNIFGLTWCGGGVNCSWQITGITYKWDTWKVSTNCCTDIS